jgi:excisionase family DNA binding protein
MPQATVEPWISLAEIAQHLGVHVESVRRWVKGNGMPAAKIGKVWRFKVSEVDRWAKAGSSRKVKSSRTSKP